MTVYAYSAFQIGPGQWQIVDTAGGGPTLKGYNSEAEAQAAANKLNAGLSGTEKQYASSETAGDAAGPNTDSATQNTGTDSSDHSDPVTQEEQKNQNDTNDSGNDTVRAVNLGSAKSSDLDIATADYPVAKTKTVVSASKAIDNDPNENPLDAYPSYTYGISLHMLTRNDYNAMVKKPTDFKPTATLISSASRYQDTRDPEFKDDFYFDYLKMSTVVGLNSQARGTNAIKIEFGIIEPYGMTLLDRIMHVNNDLLDGKNYLDMPYLLEVNFFGADDKGFQFKLEDHTKWLPVKIINFKIKASVKGSEYQIEAVPFNHSANLETIQAIKTRMEITASTVGEYFANTEDPKAIEEADSIRKQAAIAAEAKQVAPGARGSAIFAASDPRRVDLPPDSVPADLSSPGPFKNSSFTAAYNAWNRSELKNNNQRVTDLIKFRFHSDEIANSSIVDPKKNSARGVASTDAKKEGQSTAASSATPVATANFKSTIHSLEPGTTVNDVINLVLPQSEYFLNQVIDASTQTKSADTSHTDDTTAAEAAKPVKLWKIIPSVNLDNFDSQRNVWGKTVTFHIISYTAYNNRDSRISKSPPPPPVKQYNYMYTGSNKSVINFDLDFNALYFTAYDTDRGKTSATAGAAQKSDENNLKDKKDDEQSQSIDRNQTQLVSNNFQSMAGGATNRSATQNAASTLQSIYTSAAGDMINLKLQILGDPEFIKQDDLFISPEITTGSGQYVTGSKSLNMDDGEIYCVVNFKTPTDFNDSTGLYDLQSSSKYRVSEFSGYYRVLTVESEFRGGKFTQTLNLVRYPNQDPQNQSNTKDTGKVKTDATRNADAKDTSKTDNTQVSGADVERAPDPVTPKQEVTVTEDGGTNLFAGQGPQPPDDTTYADLETKQLEVVANLSGPAKTVEEATSADGNTVAVQTG